MNEETFFIYDKKLDLVIKPNKKYGSICHDKESFIELLNFVRNNTNWLKKEEGIKKPNLDKKEEPIEKRVRFKIANNNKFRILGVIGTKNIKEKRRTDIILINKKTNQEYQIYNWKNVYYSKPKNTHNRRYEVYSEGELIIDGEYIVKDERKARQIEFIEYILKKLELI